MLDRIIMMFAFTYCNLWHKLRCRTFRRIDDFNYHVFAIPQMPNQNFIKKKVEVNNLFEKTVSVKIGNVCVRYSVDKTIKNGDVTGNEVPSWVIKNAITTVHKNKHHNFTVLNITNKREKSDVTARSSNS